MILIFSYINKSSKSKNIVKNKFYFIFKKIKILNNVYEFHNYIYNKKIKCFFIFMK